MKVLAIQPFLKGYTILPFAGGKDKAALEIGRCAVANGHELYVLPLPWGEEVAADEHLLNPQPFLLSDAGLQATALPTVGWPQGRKLLRHICASFSRIEAWKRPLPTIRKTLWKLLVDRKAAVRRTFENHRYDLVHNHQTGSPVVLECQKSGFAGPVILTNHSATLSRFLPFYDHVIFVNRYQRDLALTADPSLAARSSIIYYFADDAYHVPVHPQPSHDILFVGIMDSHRKGLDLILKAFARFPELNRYRLQIVGEGPLRLEHERFAKRHAINAHFWGKVAHAKNAELMGRAALFLMPSRNEGLALVYLESLCMGLPIIGYPPNVMELEALMEMPVGDPYDAGRADLSELAASIHEVMDGSNTRFTSAVRKLISRRARELFSLSRFHRQYNELYNRLKAA